MSFWEDLKEKATHTGKKAVDKTKELTEIAKIKLALSDEQKKISAAYEKIGIAYAQAHEKDADKLLPEEFEAINEANEKIASYKLRLRALKGLLVCDACGEEIPSDTKFCPNCGKELANDVAVEAEAADTDAE